MGALQARRPKIHYFLWLSYSAYVFWAPCKAPKRTREICNYIRVKPPPCNLTTGDSLRQPHQCREQQRGDEEIGQVEHIAAARRAEPRSTSTAARRRREGDGAGERTAPRLTAGSHGQAASSTPPRAHKKPPSLVYSTTDYQVVPTPCTGTCTGTIPGI